MTDNIKVIREAPDKYWCLECKCFVADANHRCEQWSNVLRIPKEALDRLDRLEAQKPRVPMAMLKELVIGQINSNGTNSLIRPYGVVQEDLVREIAARYGVEVSE